MDTDISQRVVGLLSALTSDRDPYTEGAVEEFLSDFFKVDISVPEPYSVQDVAQAVADKLQGPLTDLFMAFTMAFVRLAEINDDGASAMDSREVLQELALFWEQDASN